MKTNIEFVNYMKTVLNKKTVYMWGDYGRKVTMNTINGKASQYPSHYSRDLVNYLKTLIGQDYYGYDCCGLIKAYFMSDYGTTSVIYDAKYDKDAYGITVGNASEKGYINSMPEIPGLLLYMKGHCGVYIGNGEVIECTASQSISKTKYGKVCLSKLTDRNWQFYTKSKWLDYVNEEKPAITNEETYIVQKGDTLTQISKKYNVNIDKLAKLNNIKNKNLIYTGTKLLIPSSNYYIVQKNDSLSSIAKKYNTSWQELYNKNKDVIKEPNVIYPNQKIKI